MSPRQKAKIIKLIRSNLLKSTGCTEPIAIAYASSICKNYLGVEPSDINLCISKNMIKNALNAGIPNSKYCGAAFASSLGGLFADSTKGFQLLENLTEKQHEIAHEFSIKNVNIEKANTNKSLYIEVIMHGNVLDSNNQNHVKTVKVIIEDSHTNLRLIEVDGNVVFDSCKVAQSSETCLDDDVTFSIKEVFEYAESLENKEFNLFEEALSINKKLSDEGQNLNHSYGLNVGKTKPFNEISILSRIVSAATSGIDARMAGAPYPAMACTGSGNQGITTIMPVYQTAVELGASHEKTLRAIAVSIVSAIYVKSNLNPLSHLCGAVIASCGTSAGIVYLLGGDYKTAEYAIKNVLATLTGMFCDGAKCTCAMKVLTCVTMSVYAATMAINHNVIDSKVGIACPTLLDTIKNVAKIEKETSQVTDSTIMNIIIQKD